MVDKELPDLNPKTKLQLVSGLKGELNSSTSKTLTTPLNEKSTSSSSSNSNATTTPRSVMSDLNKTTTNSQNVATKTTSITDDLTTTKNSNSSKKHLGSDNTLTRVNARIGFMNNT